MGIKLALFDMDGTAVRYQQSDFHSSWDALGVAAGVEKEWETWLNYYLPKPDLYEEWFEKNCRSLEGIPFEQVVGTLFPPPYTPGFKEICDYFHSQDVQTGIVSSGVGVVAERIQKELGLDFVLANEVHRSNGTFSGEGTINVHIKEKGHRVRAVLEEKKFHRDEVIFFGDYLNDIPAWREVGYPMGVNVKHATCHQHIIKNFDDFYQVLPFLEDFVSADSGWKDSTP